MTAMTDGIVIGYDGSPGSDEALRWAAREAWARGTVLTLCLAWPSAELTQLGNGSIQEHARSGARRSSPGGCGSGGRSRTSLRSGRW